MKVNLAEVRNNSRFYEVVLNNVVLFTGTPKDIMHDFGFTPSDWNKLHARKQSIDGITIRTFGRIQLLYKHKGFIGTKEDIIAEFGYKSYVLTQGIVRLNRAGYYFDSDADNWVIEEEKKADPVIKEVKKKVYSPNQNYVDSLFNNCFKGWRA